MYILDVIPLAFIPRNQAQILSYFSETPLPRGAVIGAMLGNRKIKAVVIYSEPIKNRKLDFKKNVDFELRNIIKVISPLPQVANWQFRLANHISNYYYAPLGVCLDTILPPFWEKPKYKTKTQDYAEVKPAPTVKFIPSRLDGHDADYRKNIESALRSGKQVFLMVAENTAAEYFISRYADLEPLRISSTTTNKKYYEVWQKVQSGEAKLIIGTRVGIFLPFAKLGLIIIDDESNENYKSDMMPRYRAPGVALQAAAFYGAKVIIGAVVPKLETYSKFLPAIADTGKKAIIINMVDEIRSNNFSIFSREIKEALNSDANTILYIPRRGYANFLLCQKCGQPMRCPNCSASMTQHKEPGRDKNATLLCHHCNHSESEPKSCPACGSYKLKVFGVGTEKVMEELLRLEKRLTELAKYGNNITPKKFTVFRLDSDATQNNMEKEMKILEEFRNTRGATLVATQIILSYQYLIKTPIVGIINSDTLINIPDFRAEESLFRQLYTLREMSDKLLIQTHNPEDEAIKEAATGNIKGFFAKELENRKFFSYPPFSILIKLTYRDKNPIKARNEARIVSEKLKLAIRQEEAKVEMLGPSPAFIEKERGNFNWNIILKTTAGERERNELLRYVPGGWITEVDPKNII